MPLFLITGSAGTGKSSVCRELKRRGIAAYDTDEDGFAKWQNLETGYIHPKSSVKAAQRTPEFLKMHSWNVQPEEIEQLREGAKDKSVFVCGALGNEDALRHLFDGVFALYVDDATLKHRLATRSGNDWGTQEHEVQQTLAAHHANYPVYQRNGAVIVDANQPLPAVVDAILRGQ